MCPVSRPVKCDDGQCVSTILDCSSMEGCMAPYECMFFFRVLPRSML